MYMGYFVGYVYPMHMYSGTPLLVLAGSLVNVFNEQDDTNSGHAPQR